MEKRLVLAVVLMMAVVLIVNILFPPPAPPPRRAGGAADTTVSTAPLPVPEDSAVHGREAAAGAQTFPPIGLTREPEPSGGEDTVWISGPLYRFGFAQRGARLVSGELLEYESLAPESRGQFVELIPPGAMDFLSHRWVVADDTFDLRGAVFEIEPRSGVELTEWTGAQQLHLTYQHPETPFRLDLEYTFRPDSYLIDLEGRIEGAPATGWWLIGLGPGLASNEWNPEQDDKNNLAFAALSLDGVKSKKLGDIEPGERVSLDGPFDWVALRNKYFVAAIVLPADAAGGPFAGLLATGRMEAFRADGAASFQIARDGRFSYHVYLGPQDYGRLAAVGRDLDRVTPYGYKLLQPIIRPLVGGITDVMVWSHRALRLSYGWVLILFGIAIRVVLFPLYQKSMRSQLATMRVQPLMKEIQTKYKNDPQRLQQEMMKLYKEHKVNPLGGCLPMLLPFPILIALFFVFRDTIEFRGVPFLWLPDLSRPDPLYLVPILMGASVFLLQWIGQRGMPANPQMKMMMWIMPIFLTVIFLNFASGLNLYYATMNLASLPQQLYLSKERRAAAAQAPVVKAKT